MEGLTVSQKSELDRRNSFKIHRWSLLIYVNFKGLTNTTYMGGGSVCDSDSKSS